MATARINVPPSGAVPIPDPRIADAVNEMQPFFDPHWVYESPVIPETGPLDFVYGRFSTDMQRPESNRDQFRSAYQGIKSKGLNADGFIYLCDDAVSGRQDSREELDRILALVPTGRVRHLVVIHQERLSRGVNPVALITDIKFHGGRFISLNENVDTNEAGWELHAGIVGIVSNQFLLKTAERSRDGLRERHRDTNGSTGHMPYGYRSIPEHQISGDGSSLPDNGRSKRPKMIVVKHPEAAALVTKVFELFVNDNYSIAAIVRWLEQHRDEYPALKQNSVKGRSAKKRTYHAYVRAMLANPKYVGRWAFGKTRTIYNSKGKKRSAKVADNEVLWRERPDLAIVPTELWNAAQAKLQKLKEIHGMRAGHGHRGPREHYLRLYAKSLVQGLMTCEVCGCRMVAYSSSDRRLQCQGVRKGICTNNVTMPLEAAEKAVLSALISQLKSDRSWVEATIKAAYAKIETRLRDQDSDAERLGATLREVEQRIDRMLEAIESGTNAKSLSERLLKLEGERDRLRAKIEESASVNAAVKKLPDAAWFDRKLDELIALAMENPTKIAHALRPFIKSMVAVPVKLAWQKRGGFQIRVTFDIAAGIQGRMGDLPGIVAADTVASMPGETTVILDLTTQISDEARMREIDALVAVRESWSAIGRRYHVAPAWLKTLHERWKASR